MTSTTDFANDIRLNGAVLLAQLQQLGNIGCDTDSGGRTRIALTDDEKAGRDQLVAWMRELDLDIGIDQIGNIFGTLLPATPEEKSLAPLMIGSHIDTVKNAGALDGCYGVLSGLAVVRAFREANKQPNRPITIAAFTNEEGVRYQPDMMGSLVCAGGLSIDTALQTIGTDGTRLGDELKRIGYAGDIAPTSVVPYEYLELHIEQGPILEAEAKQIGVVENLQGISWQKITIQGNANHAGTTPMRLRNDAGWAAASVMTFLRELAASSTNTLATVGSLKLAPDLINVIARSATFTVDLRDPDEQQLRSAERRLQAYLAVLEQQEGVKIVSKQLARFEPVIFNTRLVDEIETSAQRLGFSYRRMTSGAGHDAQMIARIAPAGMIFVPSRDGISHNPREHTDDEQLLNGAQVLLDVVLQRLEM
ncbi:Zn-dependent hydrolase [Advenella mimigardefordensis]|uniref:Putative hydantase n=1 Tax=Advenella mimigardefordensis (strain DSM 17166 / LMG 22922 / DPN7) TaxID=1247726 RepID=W0PAR5_ADVMD|nr:Zn-dependent hydrolase [Advenella mimigardefordensis]AHG63811.1 putative hydantase [Advenella mimigardefordensis DPN7]